MSEQTPIASDKEWPDADEIVPHEDLVMPLRRALDHHYHLVRKEGVGDTPYDGYNIGKRSRAQNLSPSERLSADELAEVQDNDPRRDPATEIISLAVQVGMEQGRRREAQERTERLE
jgi:hypothetical protein